MVPPRFHLAAIKNTSNESVKGYTAAPAAHRLLVTQTEKGLQGTTETAQFTAVETSSPRAHRVGRADWSGKSRSRKMWDRQRGAGVVQVLHESI